MNVIVFGLIPAENHRFFWITRRSQPDEFIHRELPTFKRNESKHFCEFAEPERRFGQIRWKAKGQIKLCCPTFLTFQTGKEASLQKGSKHRNWWSCGRL